MPYIYHIEPASMKHDANLDRVPCPVMYYGNMITHLILLYTEAMTCHTIQSRSDQTTATDKRNMDQRITSYDTAESRFGIWR